MGLTVDVLQDLELHDLQAAARAALQETNAIALIELLDRDGRVRRTLDVHAWPLTLGRALDNSLVLDDPHVAPHHATLATDADGTVQSTGWAGQQAFTVTLSATSCAKPKFR